MEAGDIYETNTCGKLQVLRIEGCKEVYVIFLATGFKRVASAACIRKGAVRDLCAPIVYGRGFHGVGRFTFTDFPKIHKTWTDMLKRCYCPKYHNLKPTYIDCEVDDRWLNFQNYAEWHVINYVEGYQLDKDLVVPDNKIYSPETCCFISHILNTCCRTGVGIIKAGSKFRPVISISGEKIMLEVCLTEFEANRAYRHAKRSEILRQMNLPTTPDKVKAGLLQLSRDLL